jgi:AAA domain-containing protein
VSAPVPGLFTPPPVTTIPAVDKVTKTDKILDGIMSRITTPAEIKRLKVVVYCRPGLGKTTFGASAPKPCFLDIDDTTVSLQQNPAYRDIPVLPYVSEYQAEMVVQKLIEGALWPDRESFVFDSATVFQNKSLKTQIRTSLGIRDESQVDSMLTRYLSADTNYNANTQYLEDMIAKISKIQDKHVIITAHVKKDKDSSTGIDRYFTRPDLTNKAYQALARWANVIGYLEVVGEKRTLQIQPSVTIDAKSHIGGPAIINNPTFQSLLDIMEGKK